MITIEPPRSSAAHADAWTAWGLSRPTLARFTKKAQAAVGLQGDVEILLAGDATLRRLNRDFRAKDKPTDVLSFPAPSGFAGTHAGDLAISLQTAQRQATEHGHTLADEVRVLLLHGLLHLSGMDHETDSGEMEARETTLRKTLKLPLGLINRTYKSTNPPKVAHKTTQTAFNVEKRRKVPHKSTRNSSKRVTA
ncbi:MAG TPA: rRNA maturation RNase YbeY [Acidobacteriaceae bacterium]